MPSCWFLNQLLKIKIVKKKTIEVSQEEEKEQMGPLDKMIMPSIIPCIKLLVGLSTMIYKDCVTI